MKLQSELGATDSTYPTMNDRALQGRVLLTEKYSSKFHQEETLIATFPQRP
jgi:hypothetical protein